MQTQRWHGKRRRLPLLAAALLCGCATAPAPSSSIYQVRLPELQAQPIAAPCHAPDGRPATCRVLLEADYEAIVRELKAACLANGGTPARCQADDPMGQPPGGHP